MLLRKMVKAGLVEQAEAAMQQLRAMVEGMRMQLDACEWQVVGGMYPRSSPTLLQ